jgi:hypothetical protein
MAATDDTSPCRVIVSTPKSAGNEFYRIRQNKHQWVLTLHWSEHPEKAVGLYRIDVSKDGIPSVTILDKAWHDLHSGYRFVTEPGGYKGLRSPWYDEECKRRSRFRVAQELDIDYQASGGSFADPAIIERIVEDFCLAPLSVGELAYDTESVEPTGFLSSPSGRLRLWCGLSGGGPPQDEYVVAGDPSVGAGASNSVWTIANRRTREVVGEWVSPFTKPDKMGEYGVALCKWFHGAILIWECNGGTGRILGDRVMDLQYQNLWMRRKESSLDKQESEDTPGFFTTAETKMALISEYLRAVEGAEFKNRSEDSVREVLEYQIENGKVVHVGTKGDDPSGAEKNHGDRVISAALAWKVISSELMKSKEEADDPEGYPDNSHGRRRQRWLESQIVESW